MIIGSLRAFVAAQDIITAANEKLGPLEKPREKAVAQDDPAVEIEIKNPRKLGHKHEKSEDCRCYKPISRARRPHCGTEEKPEPPTPDFDGNGVVDLADLGYLLSKFGQRDKKADLDGNGIVDGRDLRALLDVYGTRI